MVRELVLLAPALVLAELLVEVPEALLVEVPEALLVEAFLRTMVLEVDLEALEEAFLRVVAVTINHVMTKGMSVWT